MLNGVTLQMHVVVPATDNSSITSPEQPYLLLLLLLLVTSVIAVSDIVCPRLFDVTGPSGKPVAKSGSNHLYSVGGMGRRRGRRMVEEVRRQCVLLHVYLREAMRSNKCLETQKKNF